MTHVLAVFKWETEGIHWVEKSFELHLNPKYLLFRTHGQGCAWWCAPVVPATREAEAGELLELGGSLQ